MNGCVTYSHSLDESEQAGVHTDPPAAKRERVQDQLHHTAGMQRGV